MTDNLFEHAAADRIRREAPLARRVAPRTLDDVVGQDHVTRTLKNAIESGRIAHAYLFVGPRGIGKTTLARIFAKALSCEKGPTPTPCDACDLCREIAAGNSFDVLEIDGNDLSAITRTVPRSGNTSTSPARKYSGRARNCRCSIWPEPRCKTSTRD